MSEGVNAIIYPVEDLPTAKALYTGVLGVEPVIDQPYYVGYKVGDLDVGLDPSGHKQGLTGTVVYWQVGDIKASMEALLSAGAQVLQDVRDVGGGKLIATLKDADGNVIGLAQPA